MFGLHLIKNPSGTFSFVGTVPVDLAWTTDDGRTPSPEQMKIAAEFGPRLARVRPRTWQTVEEALRDAEALGYTVASIVRYQPA